MRTALAILLLTSTSVLAQDARKIDFSTVITDADDKPIVDCAESEDKECKVKRSLTLGTVAMRSLSAPEQGVSADKSLKKGHLAISVYRSTGAQLTAEEISMIKDAIAKVYTPIVVARAYAILDPATVKSDAK